MSNTTDIELKSLINGDLLEDERVSSQNISLKVVNGHATLSGTIVSFRRKLAAQQIVAAYEGIRTVQNDLVVEPSGGEADEEVAGNVRAALDSSADVTKKSIAVSVTGGKVTLSGNVASHWERVVAEDVARGVRGVRDVVNVLIPDVARKAEDCKTVSSVQAALGRARGLKNVEIGVAIGDDTVVLSGSVHEPWQKEVAQTVVGRFGFLHIRNDIIVSDSESSTTS